MFIKSSLFALAAVASIPATFARELIVERDGRPFYPRRFGQEQCGGIGGTLGSACAGQICGVLGGRVPGVLLAAADPCAQQNLADDIIDASKTQDATTATNMVSVSDYHEYSPLFMNQVCSSWLSRSDSARRTLLRTLRRSKLDRDTHCFL